MVIQLLQHWNAVYIYYSDHLVSSLASSAVIGTPGRKRT